MVHVRSWVALVAAFLVAPGCLSEEELGDGPQPFEPVAAPDWEPGYTWNYRSTVKHSGTDGSERDEEARTDTVIVRVTNTTTSLQGLPVYFLRIDGQGEDTPFWSDAIVALTQDQLVEVASGHVVPNTPSYSSCSSPKGPYVRTNAADPTTFPGPRFPLDDGQEWTGRVSPDEGFTFEYTSKVIGLERVEVPAGRLAAVHIHTELESVDDAPSALGSTDLTRLVYKVTGDLWYSPEARYFAKAIVTFTQSQLFPRLRTYEYESTLVLDTYLTSVKPSEPAPRVEDAGTVGYRLRLLTSNDFPVDVGAGPKAVRFGFEATADPNATRGRYGHGLVDEMSHYDGTYRGTEDYQPPWIEKGEIGTPAYDHERYEADWDISGPGAANFLLDKADTYEGQVTQPGAYTVSLSLRPKGCRYESVAYGVGRVAAISTKQYEVAADVGTNAQEKLVESIPIKGGPMDMNVSWSWSGADGSDPLLAQALALGPVRDGGQPLLRTSADTVIAGSGTGPVAYKNLGYGTYQLKWKPEGGRTEAGPSPLLFGHRVTVTVRLEPNATSPTQPYWY